MKEPKEPRTKIITRYLRAHSEKCFDTISKMIKIEQGYDVTANELHTRWQLMVMGINKR